MTSLLQMVVPAIDCGILAVHIWNWTSSNNMIVSAPTEGLYVMMGDYRSKGIWRDPPTNKLTRPEFKSSSQSNRMGNKFYDRQSSLQVRIALANKVVLFPQPINLFPLQNWTLWNCPPGRHFLRKGAWEGDVWGYSILSQPKENLYLRCENVTESKGAACEQLHCFTWHHPWPELSWPYLTNFKLSLANTHFSLTPGILESAEILICLNDQIVLNASSEEEICLTYLFLTTPLLTVRYVHSTQAQLQKVFLPPGTSCGD